MHRHHPGRRQQVVEDAEHRLLHLAGISGAADQDQLLGQVDRDHRLRAGAVTGRIGAEAGQIDDREFGLEASQILERRADEQGADEQAVPGELVDDADPDAVLFLRSAVEILDEQGLLVAQCGEEIGLERRETIGVDRGVIVPPDRAFRLGVADDELVLGRAAGMLAGLDDQRAVLGDHAFAARDRFLDQRRGAQIPA